MNHRRTLRAPLACVMALCGAAALLSTTALVGCSNQPDAAQKDDGGQVQVVAMGLTAADVGTVTVTVTKGTPDAGATATFNLAKNADGTWSGTLTGIPVGTGYTFAMTATSATGTLLYQGAASSVSVSYTHLPLPPK